MVRLRNEPEGRERDVVCEWGCGVGCEEHGVGVDGGILAIILFNL